MKGVENVIWTTNAMELRIRYKMYDDGVVGTEEQRVRIGRIMMNEA